MFKFIVTLIPLFNVMGAYITINEGTNKPYTYGCLQPEYSLLTKGMVAKTKVGGKHFSYMIDWDGTYNAKPWDNNHKSKNGWNNFVANSQNKNAITHNMGVKTTLGDCKIRCDLYEHCLGFTFGRNDEQNSNNEYCQMLTQCKKKSIPTTKLSSYLKKDWPSWSPETISVFSECTGTALTEPSTLGLDVPPTVIQCKDHCQTFTGAQYFQIDKNLHCQCFSYCTPTEDSDSTDKNNEEATWRTIIYEMGTPPSGPQPTSQPTEAPTRNGQTGAPTSNGQTGAPTRNSQPTGAPTRNGQTGAPTAASTTAADSGGISTAAAAGATFGAVVGLFGLFQAFKYIKTKRASGENLRVQPDF